jgi:hypothetical protein
MAIAFVKSASGNTAGTTSITAAFGSATTTGNLVVLSVACWSGLTAAVPAGWTVSTGMSWSDYHGAFLWWRFSAGETSYAFTLDDPNLVAWTLHEFSGVHATPYDISTGTITHSGSGSNYTTPSITPTSGNRLLIATIGGQHPTENFTAGMSGWTNSFTAGATKGLTGAGGSDGVITGTGYRIVAANGSTGYATNASYFPAFPQSQSGLIISLKEAAVATATVTGAQTTSAATQTGTIDTAGHGGLLGGGSGDGTAYFADAGEERSQKRRRKLLRERAERLQRLTES